MQSDRTWRKHSYAKGQQFGRLTLTGKNRLEFMYGQHRRLVEADCICGEIRWYVFKRLISGETQSCGCYQADMSKGRMSTHGLSNHPLYDVYQHMLKRCYIDTDPAYKDYGKRGITVCDEWQESFTAFFMWAMSNGWVETSSIDRKNNDGPYHPNNCQVTNRYHQNRNTRRNVNITAFGETKVLFDWGNDARCSIGVWGLRSRYDRGKYTDMEKMITDPGVTKKESQRAMKTNRMLTAFGETKCLNAWLEDKRCTVKVDSLRDRLNKGWEHEKAISFPARRV